MDSKSLIKQFILTQLVKDSATKDLSDIDSLIDSGIIDSLAIMKLLSFLEEQFEIQIGGDELVMENFETIDAIEQMIAGKKA